MKFFRISAGYLVFDHRRCEEPLEELKAEPADEETKQKQTQFVTTCDKNEQQQDGKNSAEL
jgi:hypothetical protein